jgi:hypothetical protein
MVEFLLLFSCCPLNFILKPVSDNDLAGTEEPNGEGTTHTETCVPDNLLSNATLSSSSPDILGDTKVRSYRGDGTVIWWGRFKSSGFGISG